MPVWRFPQADFEPVSFTPDFVRVARHWPGKGNYAKNYTAERDACEANRPRSESTPAAIRYRKSDALHGLRDLLVLRCFAITNFQAPAGWVVIRSASGKQRSPA